MAKVVEQSITFPATAAELYAIYMDSERHAAAIKSQAAIDPVVGGRMTAHNSLSGRFLELVPGRLIVQTWRGKDGFKPEETDSILVLAFSDVEGGAQIQMMHTNLPDHSYKMFRDGWKAFYWERWQQYLAGRKEA